MARKARSGGRRRAPRKAAGATKGGREAAIAQKARIVSLEARITVLERLVWSHHDATALDMQDMFLSDVHPANPGEEE